MSAPGGKVYWRRPRKIVVSRRLHKNWLPSLVVNHQASQFGATFRNLHYNNHNLILRPLCGPFYPEKYNKICTGKLIFRPLFHLRPGAAALPCSPSLRHCAQYRQRSTLCRSVLCRNSATPKRPAPKQRCAEASCIETVLRRSVLRRNSAAPKCSGSLKLIKFDFRAS